MSDYSPTDRLLHRLALGRPFIAEMLHDIERVAFLAKAPPFDPSQHVFVTGLARAGTTILMRELYQTGVFGSLTYADMPFVLAPNLWARLSRHRQKTETKERAHGDGIKIGVESPEALDEVYWRVVSGIDYVMPGGLRPHAPNNEAIAGYADYIRLILRRTGRSRYLSKNNNMLLRLASLAEAWPQATFLVPLRDPLQHAASLLRQHRRFLDPDQFTRDYMTWLAHHEFGATHRPFMFGEAPTSDPSGLDYWLSIWIAAHLRIQDAAERHQNIVTVSHDRLCDDPRIWAAVLERVGIEPQPMTELRDLARRDVPAHDAALAAKAVTLYSTLRKQSLAMQ